jgi:WD40 repeat protein
VELKKPFPGGKAVSFSPDGKWVAYSDSHTTGFRALDENYGSGSITTGTEIEQLKEKLPASLTWSPDSLYIAFSMPTTPDGDWRVGMMGVTAETKPKNLAGHKGKVTAVAWSRDGKYLASGGELGAVIIWEAKTFKKLREMNYGGGDGWSKINALAFSHDSKTLAIALELAEAKNAQRVILLDPETGERRQNDLQFFWNAPPMTVAFSPDGKTMLVGCGYKDETRRKLPPDERKKLGEVRIFTTEPEQPKANPGVDVPPAPMAVVPKWREKATLKDTDDLVFSVAFDPKGKTFAAGGLNGKITLWNAGNLHLMFGYESSPIFPFAKAITYSPDGSYVAENFKGGSRVIPAELIKLLRTEILPEDEGIKIMKGQEVPLALAFGPTEEVQGKKLNRLAMTDGQSVIATIWIDGGPPSTAKFGPLADAPKIEGVLPAGVAYSPDGKQLVFIPNNRMPNEKPETNRIALVWGGGSGAPMVFLKHGPAMVTAVAWSRDNSFIATGDASGDVVLWETKTFKQVRRMKIGGRGGNSYIHSLAFTTNGKTLAVGCTLDEGRNINRVAFFDTSTGNQVSDLQQFNSATLSLAFSPDDKTLIVGCGYRDAEARKMTAEERKKAGEVRVFTAEP